MVDIKGPDFVDLRARNLLPWDDLSPEDRASQVVKGYREALDQAGSLVAGSLTDDIAATIKEAIAAALRTAGGANAGAGERADAASTVAEPILQFFAYSHLPRSLQDVSVRFYDLGQHIVTTLPRNPERTVALRKLLEAKDAAVRARLFE